MNKNFDRFITGLFCLFLAGMCLVSLILPKESFSPQENRYLQSLPTLSLEAITSGKFMEQAEDWTADHTAGRNFWVTLKTRLEVLMGKQENNGVYFGTDGKTLFPHFSYPSDLALRVGYVNGLGDKLNVPLSFALVPDKSFSWSHLLPEGAPKVDDGSMAGEIAGLLSDRVNYIDLYQTQLGENAFYHTDHHWTTMGAAQVYAALAQGMGHTPDPLDFPLVEETDQFFGTSWSSAGATWMGPDSIHTLVPDNLGIEVTSFPVGNPVPGQLYYRDKLEVKDKYTMFLGGNQGLCILKNPAGENGRLLVVRDSYSDTLAPMLALDYEEVHLFDLRYNLKAISQYVEENGIDQVLVLYSANNFATDTNLKAMPR